LLGARSCWVQVRGLDEVEVKAFLLLIVVAVLALALLNRGRLYVRDPLATVYEDEAEQHGIQVFATNSGDVLVMREEYPGAYRILVQRWNKQPGTPLSLRCIHWIACLTDANHAAAYLIDWDHQGRHDPLATMTNREITFVNAEGKTMRVELR
jgi:hypothetical protein